VAETAVTQFKRIETLWQNLFYCGDWVYDQTPSFFLERATFTVIGAADKVLQIENLLPWPTVTYPPPESFAAFLKRTELWQTLTEEKAATEQLIFRNQVELLLI